MRSKAAEFREQIRGAERDSAKMDKLLQDGVSGSVDESIIKGTDGYMW